jgi:glucoamylase
MILAAALAAALCWTVPASADAPGAPGAVANWTAGDKDGFGTARGLDSKVWFTLTGGELSEIYAPDLGTPELPRPAVRGHRRRDVQRARD